MTTAPWSTPAWGWEVDPRLSLPALVHNGTLDLPAAALLWLAASRRASCIVAAGPRLAGKTTLMAAYRDLLPPDTEPVYTQGVTERFRWLGRVDPARAYILVNELSDHTPYYLWMPQVRTLFELVAQGYRVGATLHADSPQEALEYLASPPARIPPPWLAGLHLVAVLAAWRARGGGVVRRVVSLSLLAPQGSALPQPVPLAGYDPDQDRWWQTEEAEALRLLEERLGLAAGSAPQELERRASAIRALLAEGLGHRDRVAAQLRATGG